MSGLAPWRLSQPIITSKPAKLTFPLGRPLMPFASSPYAQSPRPQERASDAPRLISVRWSEHTAHEPERGIGFRRSRARAPG